MIICEGKIEVKNGNVVLDTLSPGRTIGDDTFLGKTIKAEYIACTNTKLICIEHAKLSSFFDVIFSFIM